MLEMGKVGRNEPCGCGSGRKFKKCCGASADPPERSSFGEQFRNVILANGQELQAVMRKTGREAMERLESTDGASALDADFSQCLVQLSRVEQLASEVLQ